MRLLALPLKRKLCYIWVLSYFFCLLHINALGIHRENTLKLSI